MSPNSLAAMLSFVLVECWLTSPGSEATIYETICTRSNDYVLDSLTNQVTNEWYGYVFCGAEYGKAYLRPVIRCGFGPSRSNIKVEVQPEEPQACGDGNKWTCSCNKLKRRRVRTLTEDGLEAIITNRVQQTAKTATANNS